MARASKPCPTPGCPNLQPCALHARKPWEGSTRRTKTGSGSAQQKRAQFVMRRDNATCHVCGKPGANEADHIIPLSQGGADHVSNMAPIHKTPCHQEKSSQEAQRARAANNRM